MSAEHQPAVISPSPKKQAFFLYQRIMRGDLFEPGTFPDVMGDQLRRHRTDTPSEIFMIAQVRAEIEADKPLKGVNQQEAAICAQGFRQLLETSY